ncbi:cytochrome [Sulfitobacter sp. HNIBRBA2951]|uniref:cytochrome n=1 Tax=Sulfitobacter aquimarinus TaxID=3158557 RepID=UPI0032DF1339
MKFKFADNYQKIRQAMRIDTSRTDLRETEFSLDKLNPSFVGRVTGAATQWGLKSVLLPLGQRFFPRLNVFGIFTAVTRYDDVSMVLRNHAAFEVPFGLEMTEMTGGVNFALGDDGALHDDQLARMLAAFKDVDVERDLRQPSATITDALLHDAGGEINAAGDLVTRVAAEVCLSVYGIETEDADQFAAYSMAGTALLFADPTGSAVTRAQASIAARRLREILDANIAAYVRHLKTPDLKDAPRKPVRIGVLQRLVDGYAADNRDDADAWPLTPENAASVRAMMFGLITGFVPTNTMSAGGILLQLNKRRDWFSHAVYLALAARSAEGTDAAVTARDAFTDYIFEVARFNPALAPGQFRVRTTAPLPDDAKDTALAGIAPGTVVIAATAIAMRDPRKFRAPNAFSPNKTQDVHAPPAARDLMFGAGIHECIGEYWAKAVISETLRRLLAQPEIAIASKRRQIKRSGPFLSSMRFSYAPREGHRNQTMITAGIALREGADAEAVRAALRDLNDTEQGVIPVDGRLKHALCDTGIVHFASLNLIDLGEEDAPEFAILVDFAVDGPAEQALARINDHAHALLDPLVVHLETKDAARSKAIKSFGETPSFAALVLGNMEVFQTRPYGSIGLNFVGTGEFSVAQIAQEHALYEWLSSREEVKDTPADKLYETPVSDLAGMRNVILNDPDLNARFGHLLYRPSDRFPRFSRMQTRSFRSFIISLFTNQTQLIGYAVFVLAALILPAFFALIFGVWWVPPVGYVTVWWLPPLLIMSGALIFAAVLWYHENRRDQPDTRYASHDHLAAIQEMEDLPGHMQNHLTSVSTLKPGFFRKLTFAVSLFAVKKMGQLWFRPGFVTDFATIHYAKWFRLKGTEKLIFQAHYDGSWESYLEDFITKVHGGQTAAWNNAVGFPKTNWWILDGAEDGDNFKRWVRRQQVPTLFWFARFPKLTTDVIRTNSLVRDGLARARTASQQTTWERLFSAPARPAHAIETEQVQTLLFNGLGRHRMMTARMVAFDDAKLAKAWISEMVKGAGNAEEPNLRVAGSLSFGDEHPNNAVRFLAFSAEGLRKLGMPDAVEDGLATMPHAFVDAMAKRDRLVGDHLSDTTNPDIWRWRDALPHARGRKSDPLPEDTAMTVHAVVLEYALSDDHVDKMNGSFKEWTTQYKLREVDHIFSDTRPEGTGGDSKQPRATDGFGFRDGISQPIMRGTLAFAKGQSEEDNIVDPGEFILGYPDSRGYLPLSPRVSLRHGGAQALPSINPTVIDNVPQFMRHDEDEYRDFGRNGSFLVIRQLKHDEKKFDDFVNYQASRLAPPPSPDTPSRFPITVKEPPQAYKALTPQMVSGATFSVLDEDSAISSNMPEVPFLRSANVNELWWREWVAAKMIGRWKDGSSLTRNPSISVTTRNRASYHTNIRRLLMQLKDLPDVGDLVAGFLKKMGVADFDPVPGKLQNSGYGHGNAALNVVQEVLNVQENPASRFAQGKVLWSQANWDAFIKEITALGTQLQAAAPALAPLPRFDNAPIEPDNDFRHGRDDPEGLYCPFSSHIRRTNPRDSLRPESDLQLRINNRHRLLRRGRTYAQRDQAAVEKGTLFMCFNANIERQFEFVQQTWMNSASFHGGRHGPDPLVSTKTEGDEYIIAGSETSWLLDLHPPKATPEEQAQEQLQGPQAVKRPSGPQDFSCVVGGGYFFMPSLQALKFLAHSED